MHCEVTNSVDSLIPVFATIWSVFVTTIGRFSSQQLVGFRHNNWSVFVTTIGRFLSQQLVGFRHLGGIHNTLHRVGFVVILNMHKSA